MDTLLGAFAFAAFILAQVAAVVAVHAGRERRQPRPFDATRLALAQEQSGTAEADKARGISTSSSSL